jgi:hypothetical protein
VDRDDNQQQQVRRPAQPARKKRRITVPSPERPRNSKQTPTPTTRSSLLQLEYDETLQDSPISSPARPTFDDSAIDPFLPSPTTFGDSQRNELHGNRETCTTATSAQAPLPSTPRNPTPTSRGSTTRSSTTRPDTRAQTLMSDARDTSGSIRHALVVRTYNELQRELKDAYDKVKAARTVLRRARKGLSELQAQVDVTLASAAPSSTNVMEQPCMQRLDERIQCLEAKKVTVDEQVGQYTDLVSHGRTY